MSIFIGNAELLKTTEGKRYIKWWFGKIPFLGYFDKKDPDLIHLLLDEKRISELSERNKNFTKLKISMFKNYMKE